MAPLLTKSNEHRKTHVELINDLALEFGLPEPEVGKIFEREFDSLSARARIKDFLLILVGRRVKENLAEKLRG